MLIVFDVSIRDHRTTEPLNRDLLWYEWAKRDERGNVVQEGKLHKMQGGRLDFRYNGELKVSTAGVHVVSHKRKSDGNDIKKWVEANAVELGLTELDGLVISFPDGNRDLVEEALDRTLFSYEII